MGAVTAGAGALGAVTGAISTFSEMANKKKIAAEIAKQKSPELTNIADGMKVSTLGADLQKEQQAQLASNQIDALSQGGNRALIGGIGKVSAGSQDVNAQIAANLDEQQTHINEVRAQDEGRIQTTKEQRANAKLAALSSQYNASSQNVAQGIGNVIQGAGIAGNAGSEYWSKENVATRKAARK